MKWALVLLLCLWLLLLEETDIMDRLLAKDFVNQTVAQDGIATSEAVEYFLNEELSIALVLLGGLFAGLTLA